MNSATSAPPAQPVKLFVACLCAQWCRTCDDYFPLFQQLGAEFPDAQFRWIDIEDQAELVDPMEVDNFPTVLIATDGKPRFFGTVMPHIETLRRLVQAHQSNALAAPYEAAGVVASTVANLLSRLQ